MIRRAAAFGLVLMAALSGCGGSGNDAGKDYGAFFGVSPVEAPASSDFTRMADGGIGSYRVSLAWSTIEATKGSYDWSGSDATLAELAQEGIQPIVNVTGTPAGYAPNTTDPDFWDAFTTANPGVAPQPVQVWEIWNEPNTSLFWTPKPDPSAYVDLIKRSSRVLKKVDPDAQIMVGGMFATPQSDGAIVSFDFLKDIYQHQGIADAIDLVGVHPYGPDVESVIKQLDGTRQAIDDGGDDAGIWVTELGWGSDPDVPNDLAKSPDEQAQLLTDSFNAMYEGRDKWGLKGVIWFTWRDSTGPVGDCLWCRTAGLLDAEGDSKPSWLAFTKLTGGTP